MENAMTEEGLRCICKDSDLYRTPELNDVLYCNFKGFSCIGGLERYTALKALFLEGNSLRCLTGIPCCNLTCLCVPCKPSSLAAHSSASQHATC